MSIPRSSEITAELQITCRLGLSTLRFHERVTCFRSVGLTFLPAIGTRSLGHQSASICAGFSTRARQVDAPRTGHRWCWWRNYNPYAKSAALISRLVHIRESWAKSRVCRQIINPRYKWTSTLPQMYVCIIVCKYIIHIYIYIHTQTHATRRSLERNIMKKIQTQPPRTTRVRQADRTRSIFKRQTVRISSSVMNVMNDDRSMRSLREEIGQWFGNGNGNGNSKFIQNLAYLCLTG